MATRQETSHATATQGQQEQEQEQQEREMDVAALAHTVQALLARFDQFSRSLCDTIEALHLRVDALAHALAPAPAAPAPAAPVPAAAAPVPGPANPALATLNPFKQRLLDFVGAGRWIHEVSDEMKKLKMTPLPKGLSFKKALLLLGFNVDEKGKVTPKESECRRLV